MSEKGILVVVSGFAGSGKGTLMKMLLNQYDSYALSISATTRSPRPGEEDGREYFFKTSEEFQEMIEQGEFIEYAQYVNHYYGTPKAYVKSQLETGKDVILEIEMQGALQVKKQFPETLLLFVTPPSAAILYERLTGRGTEDKETITLRMARAIEESKGIEQYDYLIVNDKLEECAAQMHAVIQNEHARTFRKKTLINTIREGLTDFSEGAE
ncbi:MAG: guanylate kinase [Lachnospiraceae bacterium]|nr:guanylate kinase [Lachnospiraceae bacterium]